MSGGERSTKCFHDALLKCRLSARWDCSDLYAPAVTYHARIARPREHVGRERVARCDGVRALALVDAAVQVQHEQVLLTQRLVGSFTCTHRDLHTCDRWETATCGSYMRASEPLGVQGIGQAAHRAGVQGWTAGAATGAEREYEHDASRTDAASMTRSHERMMPARRSFVEASRSAARARQFVRVREAQPRLRPRRRLPHRSRCERRADSSGRPSVRPSCHPTMGELSA